MKQTISNARWLFIANVGRIITQIVGLAIIARLLAPSEFGLMAMATVVTNFAGLFRDFSTGYYVVQRKEINQAFLDTVFLFNLAIGLTVGLAVFLCAPAAAKFYSQPDLKFILQLISVTFPINSISGVQQALLERQSRFRTIAFVELGAYVVALTATVVCAANGLGVISLVIQAIVNVAVVVFCYVAINRWKPTFTFSNEYMRDVLKFSGSLTAYNFFSTVIKSSDSIFFGKYLGSAMLGEYNLAARLIAYPMQATVMIISRALLPILSKVQDDFIEFKEEYIKANQLACHVGFPLLAMITICSSEFIELAFGSQWSNAPAYVPWIAAAYLFQVTASTCMAGLTSQGYTANLAKLNIAFSIVQFMAYFLCLRFGVFGLLLAYVGYSVTSNIILMVVTAHVLKLPILIWSLNIFKVFGVVCVSALLVFYIKVGMEGFSSIVKLATCGSAFLLIHCGMCCFVYPKFAMELKEKIANSRGPLFWWRV